METDWLPVRVEVGAGRGWVDVHPVRLAADGSGVQAGLDGTRFDYPPDCFTTGNPAGREVPCLTAAQQQLLHTGYEPRAQDIHDLRVTRQPVAANEAMLNGRCKRSHLHPQADPHPEVREAGLGRQSTAG